MKILIIIDHYPLSTRVLKMKRTLELIHEAIEIRILAWNRNSNEIKEDFVIGFDQTIGYSNRKAKLLNLLKFRNKAKDVVNKYQPNIIHTVDFEMMLVASTIKSKSKVVYEVYDLKIVKSPTLENLRRKIEFNLINHKISLLVLASPFFNEFFYRDYIDIPIVIMNNKPSKRNVLYELSNFIIPYQHKIKDRKIITFAGVVRHETILKNLITAISRLDNYLLLICGSGPALDNLKEFCRNKNYEKYACFTGRFEEKDLSSIYEVTDFIWGAYPNDNLNVKFAISNKFFEAIIFKKKIFISENTYLADYSEELDIGIVVNPYSIESIYYAIKGLGIVRHSKTIELESGFYWEDEEITLLNAYRHHLIEGKEWIIDE